MRERARGNGRFDFRYIKKQLIKRAKRSLRVMRLKEVKQVRGLFILQNLKSDSSNFKFYSFMNWKPVKFCNGGRDMVRSFQRRINYSGEGILNSLETLNGGIRQAIKQTIAIVKFRRNKSISKLHRRIKIKRRSDLAKLANVVEGGATDVGNVLIKGKIRLEDNS